jgi:hypothetical protein
MTALRPLIPISLDGLGIPSTNQFLVILSGKRYQCTSNVFIFTFIEDTSNCECVKHSLERLAV